MTFTVKMGVPEVKELWEDLRSRYKLGLLSGNELKLFRKFYKATNFLSMNPRHPGLNTHEIAVLSDRYSREIGEKVKVWQSYLENNTPAAGRMYWVYGPDKAEITIIGLAPHPDKNSYDSIPLSSLP